MKTIPIIPIVFAAAISVAAAQDNKDKTLGEKTSETLKKAGEKTKEAGRAVVEGTKNAADAVVDAVTPDADARKVEVKLSEHQIDMPKALDAGKTAFVVSNAGKEKHNFEIRGQGVEKQFFASVAPGDTKVLHVNLKSGSYDVFCPMKGHADGGMKISLTVR